MKTKEKLIQKIRNIWEKKLELERKNQKEIEKSFDAYSVKELKEILEDELSDLSLSEKYFKEEKEAKK